MLGNDIEESPLSTSTTVIGLGKLGAPIAACLAEQGFLVTGVDKDQGKVDAINQGIAPVFEPGLDELIARNTERLKATTDLARAVSRSTTTFIVVPTPSTNEGSFSLRYVIPACEALGRTIRHKDDFHLVVLTSTVMPGDTGGPIKNALEQASGKKCGEDFGLCYAPEFMALGTVIRDFLNPDFLLVGESDRIAGDLLEKIYQQVCAGGPPVARMNFINAELAKLSVNTFITTKISFANMLARICEHLPNANVDVVTSALGLDSRIGPKYLKGAVSYGGPCFPRDNIALRALAEKIGAPVDIAVTTDSFNRKQVRWLADTIEARLHPNDTVGILGLTYKTGSDVVEEAVGVLLNEELRKRGIATIVYDPHAHEQAKAALGPGPSFTDSAEHCIDKSDAVVLAMPWPELLEIPREKWARREAPRLVVDCWRATSGLSEVEGVDYLPLGVFLGR